MSRHGRDLAGVGNQRGLTRGRTFALALMLACIAHNLPVYAERVVLEDRRTAFQRLTVIEDTKRHERYLYSDDQRYMQGMMSLRQPDSLEPAYLRSALLGLVFADAEPSSMLFVGLGAGSLPRYLASRYPDARLDVVEIDPAVPPLARRHFGLPATSNLKVVIGDGREFIQSQPRKYDFILIDAYFGAEIPSHLATIEFLSELRNVLQPEGVVVANLPSPDIAVNFWAVLATYDAGFRHVRVFATASPVNYILVASATELTREEVSMRQRFRHLQSRHRIAVDLETLVGMAPSWGNAPIAASALHDAPIP